MTDALGNFLRRKRRDALYSMKDVETLTGVTTSIQHRIENNRIKEPSPLVLKKLATLYRIDVSCLFIMAGYLEKDPAQNVCQPLLGVDRLTEDEIVYIQGHINFLITNRAKYEGI